MVSTGNSYDRTSRLWFKFGIFRTVCSNGAIGLAEQFEDVNVNLGSIHTGDKIREISEIDIRNAISRGYQALETEVAMYQTLTSKAVKFDDEWVKKQLEDIFGVRTSEKVLENAKTGRGQNGEQTAWALYNGATQWATDRRDESKTPLTTWEYTAPKAREFGRQLVAHLR